MKYLKPKISSKKIKLNFFLTNIIPLDRFHIVGDVYAGSGDCACGGGLGDFNPNNCGGACGCRCGEAQIKAINPADVGAALGGCSCNCACNSDPNQFGGCSSNSNSVNSNSAGGCGCNSVGGACNSGSGGGSGNSGSGSCNSGG